MGIDKEKIKKTKKEKKEKKEGAKERKKTPWKEKQVMRVERAAKALGKLATVLLASKAPNIDAALAQNANSAVATLQVQIKMLADDWKPAKGANSNAASPTSKKLGIGSIVKVKEDLGDDPSAALYKMVSKDLFTGAEIVGEDGPTKKEGVFKYWTVKCADGQTRVLIKKHAMKVPPAMTAAVPPTTPAAA